MRNPFKSDACDLKIKQVDIHTIVPNRAQPRKYFDPDELLALSQSIRENGLLQPMSVRRIEGGNYELIAGERRLRACKLAGLQTVPVVLCNVDDRESAVLAMIENLQRQDLNFFEEAQGIALLMQEHNFTLEQAAVKLGKAKSTVSNKLRLLKLTQRERAVVLQESLTERHARALIRVEDPALRQRILRQIVDKRLNVEQTDQLIEQVLAPAKEEERGRKLFVIKDFRIFVNSISNAIKTMQQSGIDAVSEKHEDETCIEYHIRVKKDTAYRKHA